MISRTNPWHAIGRWLRARVSPWVVSLARCAGIAALLAVYADAPAEAKFGRLFFSADERRVLDDLRDEPPQPPPPPTGSRPDAAPVVDVISFDGKVERSGGGGTTIWVNGRPVLTGSKTVEGISIESSRGTNGETVFVLPPSDTGRTDFSLKVGQKIAVQSGKVLDSYEVRAAEDAESVFAEKPPAGAAANPDGDKPSDDAGASGAPAPTPGS